MADFRVLRRCGAERHHNLRVQAQRKAKRTELTGEFCYTLVTHHLLARDSLKRTHSLLIGLTVTPRGATVAETKYQHFDVYVSNCTRVSLKQIYII